MEIEYLLTLAYLLVGAVCALFMYFDDRRSGALEGVAHWDVYICFVAAVIIWPLLLMSNRR